MIHAWYKAITTTYDPSFTRSTGKSKDLLFFLLPSRSHDYLRIAPTLVTHQLSRTVDGLRLRVTFILDRSVLGDVIPHRRGTFWGQEGKEGQLLPLLHSPFLPIEICTASRWPSARQFFAQVGVLDSCQIRTVSARKTFMGIRYLDDRPDQRCEG